MENAKVTSIPDINAREERFLDRLSSKYEKTESAGQVRSYVIASVVIMVMFAVVLETRAVGRPHFDQGAAGFGQDLVHAE